MNYCERIPVKTKKIALSGENVIIDCEGLEVSVYADGGDIYLKSNAQTADEDAYLIKSADSITLCGSFVLNGTNAKARLLYCKVI